MTSNILEHSLEPHPLERTTRLTGAGPDLVDMAFEDYADTRPCPKGAPALF